MLPRRAPAPGTRADGLLPHRPGAGRRARRAAPPRGDGARFLPPTQGARPGECPPGRPRTNRIRYWTSARPRRVRAIRPGSPTCSALSTARRLDSRAAVQRAVRGVRATGCGRSPRFRACHPRFRRPRARADRARMPEPDRPEDWRHSRDCWRCGRHNGPVRASPPASRLHLKCFSASLIFPRSKAMAPSRLLDSSNPSISSAVSNSCRALAVSRALTSNSPIRAAACAASSRHWGVADPVESVDWK